MTTPLLQAWGAELTKSERLVKADTLGLNLLKVELDSVGYKAKLRFLNDKGEVLMKQLNAAFTSK